MDEFDNIEEPPPIYRSVTPADAPRNSRLRRHDVLVHQRILFHDHLV